MKIDKFLTVTGRLGGGAFGDVYRATHSIQGDVAVKVLRRDTPASDATWRAKKAGVLAEGRHLAEAEHPNIVRVHYVLELSAECINQLRLAHGPTTQQVPGIGGGKVPALVMEFCRGGSIDKLYRAGPMPLADVRGILTDVSSGLHTLHARRKLHRDIKPANILLHDGRAKIGDFGLVTDEIIVGYASSCGYIDHLAPEVFALGHTSEKTDVWALGMTAYRLLHGDEWYCRGPSPREVVESGRLAQTLRWLPHIPDAWRRLIRKALHAESEQRLQTVEQFAKALAGVTVQPRWACAVNNDGVRWTSRLQDRAVTVDWIQAKRGAARWCAYSEPFPGHEGRRRRLGGTAAPCPTAQVTTALQRFFADRSA